MHQTLLVVISSVLMSALASKVSSVAAFLQKTRAALLHPLNGRVNVVTGNQACDADSMVSALCFAYLNNKAEEVDNSRVYVPVCMLARQDLAFRNEVKLLLERIETDLNDLLCLEDVDMQHLHEQDILEITLLDHNVLDSKLAKFDDSVVEIIDHHADNKRYDGVTSEKRNIAFDKHTGRALVGSACTLVAERFADALRTEPDIATLLMGVIALDTINMESSSGIGTSRDADMLKHLSQISSQDQNQLFEALRGAKLDPSFWRSLTASEALRIDYKSFNSPQMKQGGIKDIGMASILQPLQDFLSKEDVVSTMERTLHEQELGVLVVMSFVHHPAPKRELLFLTRDKDFHDALAAYLHDSTRHDLNCEPLSLDHAAPPSETYLSVFTQKNTKASRKQVAPTLLSFFDQCKG
jgi:exopolyphosphatase